MIEITDKMVNAYLSEKGIGNTLPDIKRGLEEVAALVLAEYVHLDPNYIRKSLVNESFGSVDHQVQSLQDAYDDGRKELRAEALRNAVQMWERSFVNDTSFAMDRTETVLATATKFLDWLNR